MSIFNIENEFLRVEIESFGATLNSVFDKQKNMELLWQGDSKSWKGKDKFIFPFVGRLKDGYFINNEHRYDMEIHGLCPYNEFKIVKNTNCKIVLEFGYNEETLKVYPFKFKAIASFELENNCINVDYKIINCDDNVMFFGIGGHPAFQLDSEESDLGTDIKGNTLMFDKEYVWDRYQGDESNVFVDKLVHYGEFSEMHLDKSLFQNDAIILKNVCKTVTLARKNGTSIEVNVENIPILALWTHKQFGSYLCIEPWWSLPDYASASKELFSKESLMTLNPQQEQVFGFSFKVFDIMREI